VPLTRLSLIELSRHETPPRKRVSQSHLVRLHGQSRVAVVGAHLERLSVICGEDGRFARVRSSAGKALRTCDRPGYPSHTLALPGRLGRHLTDDDDYDGAARRGLRQRAGPGGLSSPEQQANRLNGSLRARNQDKTSGPGFGSVTVATRAAKDAPAAGQVTSWWRS